jgi:hypothetical protein
VKALLNLLTAAVIVVSGVVMLGRPIRALAVESRSRLGVRVVSSSDSVADVQGRVHPILARDSVTMLVFLDASCAQCRTNAGAYVGVQQWARLQGIAVRLLSPSRADALALDKSGRDADAFLVASRDFYDRLGVHDHPSVLFLDSHGVVRGRRIAAVPPNWTILRTVDENTGWGGSGRWR